MRASTLHRQQGFTLIEVLIAVSIVGILSAFAFSSYQGSVLKTRRKVAAACLVEGQQFMERFYTTRMTYASPPSPLPMSCVREIADHYTIAVAGTPTATTFRLAATPVSGSLQAEDVCGSLGINQAGARTVGHGTPDDCW